MRHDSLRLWAAAGLSTGLLELPFPLAGPLPVWRSCFAWFGLAPLLYGILINSTVESPHPLRRAFLAAYVCGVLWYIGNCYWIRDTMMRYGDMPAIAPVLLLVGFSLVLGLYFGLFGLGVMLVRRATGSTRLALVAAPFLWTALELAAARITSVPWDQLGYSQVDNALVNRLAPWTGVYGISFLLVGVNALLAGGLLLSRRQNKLAWAIAGIVFAVAGSARHRFDRPKAGPIATAVLVQPNLDVVATTTGPLPASGTSTSAEFTQLAGMQCKNYIAGIPQTGAPTGEIVCPPYATHPDLVVWPEAPSPFLEQEPRFQNAMVSVARSVQAPLIIGGLAADYSPEQNDGSTTTRPWLLGQTARA